MIENKIFLNFLNQDQSLIDLCKLCPSYHHTHPRQSGSSTTRRQPLHKVNYTDTDKNCT